MIKINDKLRKKCIKYLKDNPITMYWDYGDSLSLEQVDKIMTSKEAYWELENAIWENSMEYVCDLEYELLKSMQEEFSELEGLDINHDLRDEFLDYISIDFNMEQLLRNTPDVRVRVVVHSNYEGVGYQSRGNGNFRGNEYIREIKKMLRGKYDKASFKQELDNVCSSVNQFIFYFKAGVEDLIAIKEKFKNKITIPKNAWCGFYDSWNGSGSVLEVKLLKNVTLKKQYGETEYDSVDIVLDENNKYSVEEVYGLCNVPECQIKVK